MLYRYLPVAWLFFVVSASGAVPCPDAAALSFFENQIVYGRTQVINPFRGFRELHTDVWQCGSLSAFYVRDRPADFGPSVRMAYVFDKGGWQGGGTCATAKSWRACVEEFAGAEDTKDAVGTYAIFPAPFRTGVRRDGTSRSTPAKIKNRRRAAE